MSSRIHDMIVILVACHMDYLDTRNPSRIMMKELYFKLRLLQLRYLN